ncbi:MAG: hypothetical protein QF692_07690 [Alphaproteobacteria bacterium]|jgi:hypothetical protein|nr:hypothetical protein [Alphaproteobacteria bacterium]MDP7223128.1 hypothetical protein [Alphaproteobacteria bacterium]
MRIFTASALLCSVIALSACETSTSSVDYGYEQTAPYSEGRTVGVVPEPTVSTQTAKRVFREAQVK